MIPAVTSVTVMSTDVSAAGVDATSRDVVQFDTISEELAYWRDQAKLFQQQAVDCKEELDEFQQSSRDLEAELEIQLDQAETRANEAQLRVSALQDDKERLQSRLCETETQLNRRIASLETELNECKEARDKLSANVRTLEQQNDDLERVKRNTIASLEDFESRLNSAIERNVLLESELDEKEVLRESVQRLKDETRDLKSELARCSTSLNKPSFSQSVDSHQSSRSNGKDGEARKSSKSNGSMSSSTRLSALNIVSDLLHRVRSLEVRLGGSDASSSPSAAGKSVTGDAEPSTTRVSSSSAASLSRSASESPVTSPPIDQ